MTNIRTSCLLCLTFFFLAGTVSGQTVIVEASGTLPSGSSNHSMISDGDSFLVSLELDTTQPDLIAGGLNGSYIASGGSATFSNGFVADIDFTGSSFGVTNNLAIPGVPFDGIGIFATNFSLNAFTDDTTTFPSDAIPSIGTTAVFDTDISFGFNDSFGEVSFSNSEISFQVVAPSTVAVPEPGLSWMFCAGLAIVLRNRRRI